MSEKHVLMGEWLKERIEECEKQRDNLLTDERKDEANFEKIKENIYDVFHTVLSVADKTCNEDEIAQKQFFESRLEQIPASWKVAKEKAEQQGDVDKAYIEQIKLEAVKQIEEKYLEIWEG